jgi:hypothetical protein
MAFIGNTNTTQSFAPAIDYFNGNGSTTAFTLSRPVASVAQVQVVVNNVAQNPSSAYTVSGNTITFTSAPSSGTSNIYVYYTSPITQVVQPSQGTIGKIQLDIASLNGTGALQLPTGTTAQRPTGAAGYIRANSTTGEPEWYDAVNAAWLPFRTGPNYSVSYLVVAGGGGGGGSIAGGGGAGGLLTSSASLTTGTAYTVTIGAGGSGGASGAKGTSGSDSSITAIATTTGGGGGGADNPGFTSGLSGGSGGGAAVGGTSGTGTSGQGFAGGSAAGTDPGKSGGGGGGASAVGGNGVSAGAGGNGGAGTSSSISGAAVTYAGGGGGGVQSTRTVGAGGAGGGGSGGNGGNAIAPTAGTTNLGGGGGAGGQSASGAAGGSGVVIISYAGSQRGIGGTVTSSGGNTIHTFTSSGTYVA